MERFFAIVLAAGWLLAQPSQSGVGSRDANRRSDARVAFALVAAATGRTYLASFQSESVKQRCS
jgi:hypothetical protein